MCISLCLLVTTCTCSCVCVYSVHAYGSPNLVLSCFQLIRLKCDLHIHAHIICTCNYIVCLHALLMWLNFHTLCVKWIFGRKIQEETLRTYIFTYGETYDTLSLVCLSEMFELPLKTVHSIVSKMIFKEEFLVKQFAFDLHHWVVLSLSFIMHVHVCRPPLMSQHRWLWCITPNPTSFSARLSSLLIRLVVCTSGVLYTHWYSSAMRDSLLNFSVLSSFQIGVLAEHNEELMKIKHAGPWSTYTTWINCCPRCTTCDARILYFAP